MDVNLMPSVAPLSKIPSTGLYADVQSRTRQTRQEQERNVQQVTQIVNSQKDELESSVARNEQESSGLYTQARQQEAQQEQKFMSKIDVFA